MFILKLNMYYIVRGSSNRAIMISCQHGRFMSASEYNAR
jgi:hypothetical protein